MSVGLNRKEYLPPYDLLSEWDEVLLGDGQLFREMTEPYIPMLLEVAYKQIERERKSVYFPLEVIQPSELVGETLIYAWQTRHARPSHKPLTDWLVEIQAHCLRQILGEERRIQEPIAASLEDPVPFDAANSNDENDFWDWTEEQHLTQRWEDVIPDESLSTIPA